MLILRPWESFAADAIIEALSPEALWKLARRALPIIEPSFDLRTEGFGPTVAVRRKPAETPSSG
jgi:hypothetical protein